MPVCVRPVECPRGGEWRLMNNNNDNECLFPFFFTLPLPFLPVGQKQGLQQHQDRKIYMWAEAKKIFLGTRSRNA